MVLGAWVYSGWSGEPQAVRPLTHPPNLPLMWAFFFPQTSTLIAPLIKCRYPIAFLCRRSFCSSENSNKIKVPPIPRDKLQFSFSASSGPGGQNVNHVNTKVELRFKPSEAWWIPKEMRGRFIEQNQHRINKDGDMIITSQRERKQALNLEDCVEKLRQYLEEASYIPKERIPTEVPEHENEKRLKLKKQRSVIKQSRSRNWDD